MVVLRISERTCLSDCVGIGNVRGGGGGVVGWLGGWVVGRGVATLVLRWVKHEDMKHEEREVEPRSHEGHEAGTLERGVVGLIG